MPSNFSLVLLATEGIPLFFSSSFQVGANGIGVLWLVYPYSRHGAQSEVAAGYLARSITSVDLIEEDFRINESSA